MRRSFSPLDLVVIGLALAAFVFLPSFFRGEGVADRIRIVSAEGERIVPLAGDREFSQKGPLGETVVEVRGGQIRILSSPCPSKLCIRMGSISDTGSTIICAPNRVALRLESGRTTSGGEDVDAYSR